jgi:hypothetical protein
MTLTSKARGDAGCGNNFFQHGRKAGADPSKKYKWMIAAVKLGNNLTRMTIGERWRYAPRWMK